MGANLGQWEADTKVCFEQSCRESSCGCAKAELSMGNQWQTALVLWAGAAFAQHHCWRADLSSWMFYLRSTELFAFKQPEWEGSQSSLSRARRGKGPLVSYDPALPSQGNRGMKYCQRLVRAPAVTKLQVYFWSSWTVLPILLRSCKNKITTKSAGPVLWNNCISCSRFCTLVVIWSSFLWFQFLVLERLQSSSLVLCFDVLTLCLDLCSLFPVAQQHCPYCPLVQILQTGNPLLPGTRILPFSLTCGCFLTVVNHTWEVLSTTTHKSLRVLHCVITESISKGINHWFLTCKEYAATYENTSIFNSFLKVTQKQKITMQVK